MKLALGMPVLATIAVIAAGCGGGGGGGTTTLSKADYAAKLDSICENTNKAGESLDLSSVTGVAANGDKAKSLFDKMVADVRKIQPPDTLKDAADSFVDGLDKEADGLGQLTEAAKDGDAAKVKTIEEKLASDAAATSEDARFLGATGCARLFS